MDKLTSVQQDPNKRKKALQSTTCSDVIQLALHISMVVVGVQVKTLFNDLTILSLIAKRSVLVKKICHFFAKYYSNFF